MVNYIYFLINSLLVNQMSISEEDIKKIDQAIENLNKMCEEIRVRKEGRKVIVEYVFKDELLANVYYESLKVMFSGKGG